MDEQLLASEQDNKEVLQPKLTKTTKERDQLKANQAQAMAEAGEMRLAIDKLEEDKTRLQEMVQAKQVHLDAVVADAAAQAVLLCGTFPLITFTFNKTPYLRSNTYCTAEGVQDEAQNALHLAAQLEALEETHRLALERLENLSGLQEQVNVAEAALTETQQTGAPCSFFGLVPHCSIVAKLEARCEEFQDNIEELTSKNGTQATKIQDQAMKIQDMEEEFEFSLQTGDILKYLSHFHFPRCR